MEEVEWYQQYLVEYQEVKRELSRIVLQFYGVGGVKLGYSRRCCVVFSSHSSELALELFDFAVDFEVFGTG